MNNTQDVLNVKVRLIYLLGNHYKTNFLNQCLNTWCGAQIINYEIDIYFRVHITATLKKVNLLHNKDLRTTQK